MGHVATYIPTEIFATEAEVNTDAVKVLAGENLAHLECVMYDAAGKIVAHSGDLDTPAAGFMVHAVDASGADADGVIYRSGCFFSDKVVWPGAINTDLLKQKLLADSQVSIKIYLPGEL